jgi:predicted metallopeptidase
MYRWGNLDQPLPLKAINPTQRRPLEWDRREKESFSPPGNKSFDFCRQMHRLLADIVARSEFFPCIQVDKILIGTLQARNGHGHGLQARVTPLRFPGGHLTHQRRGILYQVQRYFLDDLEYLYVLTFCLPRFLDQDFDAKMVTIFHELFHIHPDFNGDLRRHKGRYSIHTHRQCRYDAYMQQLARHYLDTKPDPEIFNFLRFNFHQLQERHGLILGIAVPRPKIIPVEWVPS